MSFKTFSPSVTKAKTRISSDGPVATPPSQRKRAFSTISEKSFYSQSSQSSKRQESPDGSPRRLVTSAKAPSSKPTSSRIALDLGPEIEFTPASGLTLDSEKSVDSEARLASNERGQDKFIRNMQVMSEEVSSNWKSGATASAQPGFRNLTGALCYRNSLFQSLMHSVKFCNWLEMYHQEEDCCADAPGNCLSCCLRDLASLYWSPTKEPKDVTNLLQTIRHLLPRVGWTQKGQADPDDQLVMILQRMRFEIPRTVFSLFDATHTISLQSSIACSKCGHKSIATGPMEHGLSIPISPPVPGMALPLFIQNYLKEEIQGYRCEECNRTGRVIRNQIITHAPDVLTLQLKRFNWDPRTGRKSKNNAKVQIPESLNMGKHTVGAEPVIYRLRSTVCHSGNLGSGHYICFASGPDQRWKCFDDSNVSPASFSAAVNHARGMTPYLLFYERVPAPQRQ